MNYKVGDEVMCIDAVGLRNPQIKNGGKYIVARLNGKCAGFGSAPMDGPGKFSCSNCGESWGMGHFNVWRFIKLDKLTESSTEQLTEKV